MMRKRTPKRVQEPAYLSYFFLPLYLSVWQIVKSAYRNIRSFVFDKYFGDWISDIWIAAKSGKHYLDPLILVLTVLGFFTFAFAYVMVSVLLLVFCACAVVVDGVVLALCAVIKFVDMLVRRINGIWTVCYGCQNKIVNATYRCPSCNEEHKALYPGKYGILKRRCACGTVIPTTFFNGRRKLPAMCPHCGKPCQSDTIQISIPVFGGPSAGKSHIINSGLEEICRFAAKQDNPYSFEYWTQDDRLKNEQFMNALKQHIDQKTVVDKGRFDAYKFYFSHEHAAFKHLVYMFDIAGEAVLDQSKLENNQAMRYTKSYLFTLDPLSLPMFADAFAADNGNAGQYAPSESCIDDIISPVLTSLQSTLGVSESMLKSASVAIVITKGDIPLLQAELGEERIKAYAKENPGSGYNEIVNRLCEEFVRKYQASNFLDIIRMTFKRYQFFVVNTWDSVTNQYAPHQTADPFLWLIDMESRTVDLKERWNRDPEA